mmetsp:Transcript_63334/g.137828  ORF Transcript_63334/g.137828 Transcript_63334/m.137828 type:complete len:231 (-) Transcript_63334:1275-1967(-)
MPPLEVAETEGREGRGKSGSPVPSTVKVPPTKRIDKAPELFGFARAFTVVFTLPRFARGCGRTEPRSPTPRGERTTELRTSRGSPDLTSCGGTSCLISPQSTSGRAARRRTSGEVAQSSFQLPTKASSREFSSNESSSLSLCVNGAPRPGRARASRSSIEESSPARRSGESAVSPRFVPEAKRRIRSFKAVRSPSTDPLELEAGTAAASPATKRPMEAASRVVRGSQVGL